MVFSGNFNIKLYIYNSQATPCLPTPPIPGYATVCNLTAQNGGSPWYCGAPRHPELTCRDWNLTGNLDFLGPLPLPEKEKQIVRRIDRY